MNAIAATLLKLLTAMLWKLLTEGFFNKLAIRLLWIASQKTNTKLDDGIVEDAAKRLGVTDYK